MTAPQNVEQWLAAFRARHGLQGPFGSDEDMIADRAEAAAAHAAKRTPERFAGALPSVPAVEAWAAAVVRTSIERSQARGQLIATVRNGPSLLLLGPTGVGKTYEAYGALRVMSLLGLHASWLVVSAADLYARLRPRHGVDAEAEFAKVAGSQVLAVDDIGAAKNSEWVEEINFRLVNRRYEAVLPTLFTSNVPPRQLGQVLGERVASRLIEMTGQVAIKGEDRRRAA